MTSGVPFKATGEKEHHRWDINHITAVHLVPLPSLPRPAPSHVWPQGRCGEGIHYLKEPMSPFPVFVYQSQGLRKAEGTLGISLMDIWS